VESDTTYKNMAMFKTMTRSAKRNPVRWLISQFWICGERLDVVRVQVNGVAVSAVQSAMLAGVVIALKDSTAPEFVFYLVAGYAVLVGLISMTCPPGYLRSLCLFSSNWMRQLATPLRAYLPEHSALAVFRHGLVAYRTQHSYRHALSAHLIKSVKVVCALSAHLTGYTDASGVCLQSSRARYTSGIFDGLAQGGYGWRKFTALTTRREGGAIARVTNAIVSTVHFTLDAPVLCHVSIIPQLPDLEKLR